MRPTADVQSLTAPRACARGARWSCARLISFAISCSCGLTFVACAQTASVSEADVAERVAPNPSGAGAALAALDAALDRFDQAHLKGARPSDRPWLTSWRSQPSLEGARLALEQTHKDVRWLGRKSATWPPSPTLDRFADAVAEHTALLDRTRGGPVSDAVALLEIVAKDVGVKARQCRSLGGPLPVEVTVITRDVANVEVDGYEVWFVQKGFENEPSKFLRFNRYSSPSEHVFDAAGYYVLWAEQTGAAGEKVRSSRLDVEIGPTQQRQAIDLRAPGDDRAASARP
jgi:hypothetical protein